jgi:AAA domain, putative AbiEii toxin, Type IV TA system
VPLDSLLLDPNDPRLIDDPRWRPVPDEEIASRRAQAITAERLLAIHYDPVITLMESIARYGWVEAEPIRVRVLASGRLVVTDGNRRVVALRRLQDPALTAKPSASEQAPRVDDVWVLEEPSDDRGVELARAVRHAEPRVAWHELGRAVWSRDRRRAHPEWEPLRVVDQPGSSPPVGDEHDELALEMCEDYVASPWGYGFSLDRFLLFRTALHYEDIRNWLGYGTEAGPDGQRTLWFFAWAQGDPGPTNGHEQRNAGTFIPPAPFDMSQLAKLLAKPGFVESIEREGAIGPAWRKATSRPRRVSELDWSVKPVARWAGLASLRIERYRGLTGLELQGLTRINVLVGVNNAGKTSVLEAIYLLCRQADPRGLLDTVRARIRTDPDTLPTAEWIRLVPKRVAISSRLPDGTEIRVEQSTTDEPLDESTDVATLVTTLRIEAQRDHERQVSVTELHTEPPRSTQLLEGTRTWLAPAVFHSPFSLAERKLLIRCHERSMEEGVEALLIEFIQQHIDPGVESIDLVGNGRFLVQHRTGGHLDLSSYGEGMQRVFQLALLFAAHARGIVLIDELENALHTNVIIAFSRMIQELAVRFDVQVFLTTHSKETIDAFLLNGYRIEDVSTFLLRKEDDRISVRRFDGDTLKRAIEAGDVDIRGL